MMGGDVISIPDGDELSNIQSLLNYRVWRYVKEDHQDGAGVISTLCFCLTARDNGHVSFCHSNEVDLARIISFVHRTIRVGGKTKPAIYLSIDIKEAYEEINTPDELITFKACGYPHIGMYYIDYDDLLQRNLIIASLVELSDVYSRKEGGSVEELCC